MTAYCLVLALLIGQVPEVVVRPYEDGHFIYYTITSQMAGGWAMTGFKSKVHPEYGIRWLTAAHYFPLSLKPTVMPMGINGKTEYVNEIAQLGSDLCVFRLGPDSTLKVKGFSVRGPKDTWNSEMNISLFDQPDEAIYLVDRQRYAVIGSITVYDPLGEVEGFLVDKSSSPGDCGTAFLYEGKLCIITKGIPAGLPVPNGPTLGDITVVVRLDLAP